MNPFTEAAIFAAACAAILADLFLLACKIGAHP